MKSAGYENPVNVTAMEKTLPDRSNGVRKGPSHLTPDTLQIGIAYSAASVRI